MMQRHKTMLRASMFGQENILNWMVELWELRLATQHGEAVLKFLSCCWLV
jgi:hypothetical protein